MSKILVNCNLQNGNWTIKEEDMKPFYTDVKFHFSNSQPLVMFNNLTFGIKLKKGSEELFTETFGTIKKYVACENTLFENYMENCRLHLDPGTSYALELWCENADTYRRYSYYFTTPDVIEINT
jgi:hypothetical protein